MFDPLQHLRVTPVCGQVKCAIIMSLRDVMRAPLALETRVDACRTMMCPAWET
jgi:hypothetical protein